MDQLEEAIITLAELSDLRAEVDIEAEGAVIESQMEKGKGYVVYSYLIYDLTCLEFEFFF